MVTFCEARSYWQGGSTQERQNYYKEYRLSEKGKHLWLHMMNPGALMNLFAVGGINTSLSNVIIMIMKYWLLIDGVVA